MKRSLLLLVLVLAGCGSTKIRETRIVTNTATTTRASSPRALLLVQGDSFDLKGTHVACLVAARPPARLPGILCFRETKELSYRPSPGSYEAFLGEGGIAVARVGARRLGFLRPERKTPDGYAPGLRRAQRVIGGLARLTTSSDVAYVAHTHIYCSPFTDRALGVFCALVGRGDIVPNGNFAFSISDRSVIVSKEVAGRGQTVYVRLHGR
jgi:hypothetical protein